MASKSTVAPHHKFSYLSSSKDPITQYKFRESSEIESSSSRTTQSDSGDENQNEFVVHHSLSFHPSLMLLRTLPRIDAVNKSEETLEDVESFDDEPNQEVPEEVNETRVYSNSLPNFQKTCKCATKRLLKEKFENQTDDQFNSYNFPKISSLTKQ